MQLSERTVNKYKEQAPELMDAVSSGESEFIMKRDPETDYCVKFDSGWCGIHATRGTDFLGDACHFFPRVTRQLGQTRSMTASLSCPEVVRLALLKENAFVVEAFDLDRAPDSLSDYLPDGLESDKAWAVHRTFIEWCDDVTLSPERLICIFRSVAESMQHVDVASWAMAAPFYLKSAGDTLPNAEAHIADPFNVLNALQGLVGAARTSKRERLHATIGDMEKALKVTLDWDRLTINTAEQSVAAYNTMQQLWEREAKMHFEPLLRRWIQAQLSVGCFPFAGFGDTLSDRVTAMGVRFATLKLALMSACAVKGAVIDDEQTVRVVQSLSRFLDHLADPALSMQIYTETGWTRLPRLRALVNDY